MTKPLFRWTVGSCLRQGLEILIESVNVTTKTLGIDNFDWVICYNGLKEEELNFIKNSINDKPIQFFSQNWKDCPVDDEYQSPIRKDGSYEWNGNRCGGTMWKVCPARMRMETHEIVMDNDIILLKKFPQIDEFLKESDKALILEEPIRFYGRYNHLFQSQNPFLNSGFMGLPPNYDFASEIYNTWVQYGKYKNISQADEQGLLMYTLSKIPNIRIKKEQMIEVLNRDFKTVITGEEEGIHFTQANRIPNHVSWKKYQQIFAGQSALI
jgi:hypothetical protein